MTQIHGMLFRHGAETHEGYEKIWRSSEFYTPAHFLSEYEKHIVAMQHITECAKIYITKHWEEVKDWSRLNVIIHDNSKTATEYFNYATRAEKIKERRIKGDSFQKVLDRIEKKDKAKHNPIVSLTGVVLDTSDGDFSLTINGKAHLWIDAESVIIIADYIEKELANK